MPVVIGSDPVPVIIGIDPGTDTGIGVWDPKHWMLKQVGSFPILIAMQWVRVWKPAFVMFEDARRIRIPNGKHANKAEVLQGVGSVKRDCAIWEEFLTMEQIPYEARTARRDTKMTSEEFTRLTGWTSSTNSHGRDAAMIVHGINAAIVQAKVLAFTHEPSGQGTDRARARPRAGRRSITL